MNSVHLRKEEGGRNDSMKFSKKTEHEAKSVYEVNENLLNIISPAGIDFNDTHTFLGENTGKLFFVSKYPFSADYGWLAPLCNLEGTSTVIEYRHTESDRLITILDRRIKEMKGNHGALKNESERAVNEKAVRDLTRLVERLSVQGEPVGYVNIMLHIQDLNEDRLSDRIKKISSAAAVCGCNLKLLKNRQGTGLKAIAPYGIPDEDVSNPGLRNMPISTFIGGFPMANPGLYDENGYYLGFTLNNRLVIVNPWMRGKDRTNSNWVIFGPPGIGKSTFLKYVLLLEYALGTRIIMLDPEEEYRELALKPDIGGELIDCSGGKRGRINPLQARKTAVVDREELALEEAEGDYLMFEKEDQSDLSLYLQQLKVFFRLRFGNENFTPEISATLEQFLIALYEKHGITWETDIGGVPNEAWPLMEELYDMAGAAAAESGISGFRRKNCETLQTLLYSMAKGADAYLWNGPTTLTAEKDFTDLLISALLDADEPVKRAQFFNILSWAWTELSRDRSRKVLFGVDEGYLFVDPEYPDIMRYLRNYSKRLRKYEGGLMFITHSVVDLMDPAVKRFGQAIIDNACYKFIMGCDGKNLEEARKIFELSENEVSLLNQKNRGQGIFFAGNTRLNLKVDVCDEFLEMMGKAGGR